MLLLQIMMETYPSDGVTMHFFISHCFFSFSFSPSKSHLHGANVHFTYMSVMNHGGIRSPTLLYATNCNDRPPKWAYFIASIKSRVHKL